MSQGSISLLLSQLHTTRAADAQAEIFRRYYPQLVEHLRTQLSNQVLRGGDEEDLAASAIQAFFTAADQQRLPELEHRGNLWAVMLTIARRKAANQLKRRQSRGHSGFVEQSPDIADPRGDTTVDAGAIVKEMLDALADDGLHLIAILKLEGFSNQEVADHVDRSVATVERRLKLIRKLWETEVR